METKISESLFADALAFKCVNPAALLQNSTEGEENWAIHMRSQDHNFGNEAVFLPLFMLNCSLLQNVIEYLFGKLLKPIFKIVFLFFRIQ